jgi:hypothetical protein
MRKSTSFAARCAGLMLAGCTGAAIAEELEALEPLVEEPVDLATPVPESWHGGFPIGVDPSRFVPKTNSTWKGKAGVETRPALPDVPGAMDQSNGVAWANVTVPGMTALNETSFETRLDPQQQGKFGMNLSRSVPVGSALALTWRQGYTVTQSATTPNAVPFAPGNTSLWDGATTLDSSQAVGFTLLPANTTLSLGAAISSENDRWLRSLSAEQKLFGGPVSITGTVQETTSGVSSKSLKAGIKTTW